MQKKSISLKITGKVQGVGFRYSALNKATELGIKGFVKNQSDGSVYIEAESPKEIIDQFIEWCWKGPSWARVDNILVNDLPKQDYTHFIIK